MFEERNRQVCPRGPGRAIAFRNFQMCVGSQGLHNQHFMHAQCVHACVPTMSDQMQWQYSRAEASHCQPEACGSCQLKRKVGKNCFSGCLARGKLERQDTLTLTFLAPLRFENQASGLESDRTESRTAGRQVTGWSRDPASLKYFALGRKLATVQFVQSKLVSGTKGP